MSEMGLSFVPRGPGLSLPRGEGLQVCRPGQHLIPDCAAEGRLDHAVRLLGKSICMLNLKCNLSII
jgi:hypothetical protein